MKTKEAAEIIQTGMNWADWSEKQREAMKIALNAMQKQQVYEEVLKEIADPTAFEDLEDEVVTKRFLARQALESN